jgi:hypothetical protein
MLLIYFDTVNIKIHLLYENKHQLHANQSGICLSIYDFWYLRPVLTLTCLKGVMFSVQENKQRFNINYYAALLSTEGVSLIILD